MAATIVYNDNLSLWVIQGFREEQNKTTKSHFLFLLQGYLIPRAREKALDRDGASRSWKRGLHHAAHKRVNKCWGYLPAPLHLLQNLQWQSETNDCV